MLHTLYIILTILRHEKYRVFDKMEYQPEYLWLENLCPCVSSTIFRIL